MVVTLDPFGDEPSDVRVFGDPCFRRLLTLELVSGGSSLSAKLPGEDIAALAELFRDLAFLRDGEVV